MRISIQTFQKATNTFILTNVLPGIQAPWARWALAGACGVGAFTGTPVLRALNMAGVADDRGVDLDRLNAFLSAAFDAQPAIVLPGFPSPLERADGEALLAWLKQQPAQPQPEAQTPSTQAEA